jgi:hypothetical protein
LPLVAVIGASVALLCTIASTAERHSNLADTGETRRVVETTLARLQALHPSSIDDPAFREAVVQAKDDPYVAYVWLFAPDGRILQGNRAVAPDSPVDGSATGETHRVLEILPAGTLSTDQRLSMLAASAMQAEGEHNDVFRHLLREIRGPDGGLVALVGVTYDVSPGVGSPGLGWMATLLAGFLGLAAYWLSLPAWVWLDARARGERAWVWAVFVLLGNLVGLITYILARRPRPQPAAAGGVLQSTEPS